VHDLRLRDEAWKSLSRRLTDSSTIGGARRIRRLICRFLTAGFCLRLVQRCFGFSMDCFGAFFCFLAYSFSRFLRLSADSLSGLLGFFFDCFSSFLGFFARRLKSVFYRLLCFFAPCFTSCSAPSCPSAARAVAETNVIIKLVIFMIGSFSFAIPVQRKRMRHTSRAHYRLSRRQLRRAFAARTFVNGREFREWDAENIKNRYESVSQSQTHRSNSFIAPRACQDPFLAAYHATASPKQAKKFHVLH
jgi:hypothetical protein